MIVQALQALQRQPNAAQYFQQLMLQQQISSAQLHNLAAVQQVTMKYCKNKLYKKIKISLFHHQYLCFSPSKATLAAGRQSTTASTSMPQAATTVGVCCGFFLNVELSLIMVLLKQTGLPPLHRST